MSIPHPQALALILIHATLTGCQIIPQRPAASPETQTTADNAPTTQANVGMVTRQQAANPSPATPPTTPPTIAHADADTIWPRIRAGMRLTQPTHPPGKRRVAQAQQRYLKNVTYLNRIFERAEPFLHLIVQRLEAHDLPTELALLPVVESGFRTTAYSRDHASGLWQFIPATGDHYGLRRNWWYDGRRDVSAATDAAIQYLNRLHRLFDGDWLHALAAYNAGESTVRRAIKRNRRSARPTDFWHLDLPRETRNYIPRLLAISAIVRDPGHYGATLRPISRQPRLTTVDAVEQIDLRIAARMAGIDATQLQALNPGFKRWSTPPTGPHTLLIPIEQAQPFKRQLAALPPQARLRFARHQVKRGDVLGKLARRYDTTVNAIQRSNQLRSTIIRIGQNLLIPTPHTATSIASLTAKRPANDTVATNHEAQPPQTHTIVRGDTLWDIARQHKLRLDDLIAWNQLDPAQPLRIGNTLRLSHAPTTPDHAAT